MNTDKQQEQLEPRNYEQIGVVTLMRLIWKWKVLIGSGIVVCALAALFISVVMPHVYEVDMLVENVRIGRDDKGETVYLGDLKDMSQRISSGLYTQGVMNSLREAYGAALPQKISLDVSLRNKNQLADISYEAEDVEMGKRILAALFDQLKASASERILYWKKEIDRKIEEKKEKLNDLKASMEDKHQEIAMAEKAERIKTQEMLDYAMSESRLKEEELTELNEEISHIKSVIQSFESELNLLIKTRKGLLTETGQSRNLSAIAEMSSLLIEIYKQLAEFKMKNSSFAQNMFSVKMYKSKLETRINELKNTLSAEKSLVKGNNSLSDVLEKQENDLVLKKDEIAALEAKIASVKNISLRQTPISSAKALRPDTKRNVIIGAVVGLLLSLFLAVFLEYVYKRNA